MNKINEVLIGSNNKGKFKEISDLLPKKLKKFHRMNLKLGAQKKMAKLLLKMQK